MFMQQRTDAVGSEERVVHTHATTPGPELCDVENAMLCPETTGFATYCLETKNLLSRRGARLKEHGALQPSSDGTSS